MRCRVSFLALLAFVAACGDDGGMTPDPGVDDVAPRLLGSVPENMSDDAPAASPLVLFFSEPMDSVSGLVTLTPGNVQLAVADGEWSANQVLTFRPAFEAGQSYTVTLTSFRDAAGNTLDANPVLFTIAEVTDEVAPILIATMPFDGAEAPATLSSLRLTFSEVMDQSQGTVTAAAGGATLGMGVWSSPETVDIPISGLQAGESYSLRLEGFADAAGNPATLSPLLADGTLDFTVPLVNDTTAPVVQATTPIEGAPNVDPAAVTAISLTFSEPMDATRAGATFEEGASSTSITGTWNAEQTTISFPVTLRGGTDYALTPNGFQDLAGNALDGAAFLGDGKLDFTTRVVPDSTPPGVTSSDPMDGATGVPLAVGSIVVVFDEPMTTTVVDAPLLDGMTRTATLTGAWSGGDTTFTAPISGLLLGRGYRVDLRAFTDRAGNALSATALGDGFLDFSTPPDTVPPRVLSTSPAEGANDVTPALDQVVVTFDEPVLASSLAANLSDGMMSQAVTPTLSTDGREVTYDVTGLIEADISYSLDLTGVRDVANNVLNPTPVLGDGILNFTSPPPPNGFSCATPITEPYGQPSGFGTRFVVPAGSSGRNGAFTCDADGAGDDIVIEYSKTSGTLASGGQLLRVIAEGVGMDGLNVEVLGAACSGSSARQDRCTWNRDNHTVFLDAPAGTYWVWVSSANGGMGQTFPGATVTIEEVPPTIAEGEGCWQPYSATSANYVAPAVPGDPATWTIGATAINAFDMDPVSGGPGSISCDDDPTFGDLHGVDAVVEFTPSRMNSILQITAESTNPVGADINLEVLEQCDPTRANRSSLACSADAQRHEVVVTSTAPVYVWVSTEGTSDAWPGVNLSVAEIVPGPGESCATGFPINAPGTVNLNGTSGRSLGAPSCLVNGGNVEWYRYQVSGGVVQIRGNTPVEIGVVDAAGGEATCRADLSELGFGAVYPSGTTLCIAVPLGTGGTDFTVSDIADMYLGVGSSTTAVDVTPVTSWTPDTWMASTPNWVYLARDGGDVQRFPKSALTSTSATPIPAVTVFATAAQVGRAGWVFGDDRVFSLDDDASTSSSRLFRIWDGLAASFTGVSWDLTPSYPAEDARSLTFDGSELIYATHRGGGVEFFAVSEGTAQSPRSLGSNSTVDNVVGLAADSTYLYLVGQSVMGDVGGIYRLNRADLGTPTTSAVLLAPLAIDPVDQHAVYVDDPSDPTYLYVRGDDPTGILVLEAPDDDAPVNRGFIGRQGRAVDSAWTFDVDTNSIFYFESESSAAGRIIQMR